MQRTQTNPRVETVPVLRVVVAREGGQTGSYELAKDVVRFGRSPDCDVRLEGKNISRVHCLLEVRADGLWVRDNDSLNGIFVNGEKVKEAFLTPRDAVKVGPFRFKAILSGTTTVRAEPTRLSSIPAAPEMDKTLPAFDPAAAAKKPADPLPADEEPLRARPSTSAGPLLEEFVPPVVAGSLETEDKTPVDAGTPAAAPKANLRPAPIAEPAPVPAAAPAARPSYRSSFEQAAKKPEPVVTKSEAKPEAARPAPFEARAERPTNNSRPGRISLTTPSARRASSNGKPRLGDLCPSCSVGRMLAWEGGLRCRKCDHRAELESKAPIAKPGAAPIQARSSVAKPSAKPAAATKAGLGEVCGSCFKGRMLAWEGGLRCRSCGNRGEMESVTADAPAIAKAEAPIAKPAAKAAAPRASAAPVRAPNTTAAVITGVGLFFAFYVTVAVCAIVPALVF